MILITVFSFCWKDILYELLEFEDQYKYQFSFKIKMFIPNSEHRQEWNFLSLIHHKIKDENFFSQFTIQLRTKNFIFNLSFNQRKKNLLIIYYTIKEKSFVPNTLFNQRQKILFLIHYTIKDEKIYFVYIIQSRTENFVLYSLHN